MDGLVKKKKKTVIMGTRTITQLVIDHNKEMSERFQDQNFEADFLLLKVSVKVLNYTDYNNCTDLFIIIPAFLEKSLY